MLLLVLWNPKNIPYPLFQIETSIQQNNISAVHSTHEEEEVEGDLEIQMNYDETLDEGTVIDSQVGPDEAEDGVVDQDQMDLIELQPSTSSDLRRCTRIAAKKISYAAQYESSSDDELMEVCLQIISLFNIEFSFLHSFRSLKVVRNAPLCLLNLRRRSNGLELSWTILMRKSWMKLMRKKMELPKSRLRRSQ